MPKFTITLFGGPYDCEKKDLEFEGDTLPPSIGLDVLDDQSLIAAYRWTNPEGGSPIFEFVEFRDKVIGGSGNKEERSVVWREDQSPFEGDKPSEYAIENWIADCMGASPRQIKVGIDPHDPAFLNRWFKTHWHLECDQTCKMYGVDPTKFHCGLMAAWYDWADGKRHSALWAGVPRPGESTAEFMRRRKQERQTAWASVYGMPANRDRKRESDIKFDLNMDALKDALGNLRRSSSSLAGTLNMMFQQGLGGYINLSTLSESLTPEDAKALMEEYHKTYPGFKDIADKLTKDSEYPHPNCRSGDPGPSAKPVEESKKKGKAGWQSPFDFDGKKRKC